MTELETLKKKKKAGKANAVDLTRLKVLQDGEPLSAGDLEAAKQREAAQLEADKAAFAEKRKIQASTRQGGWEQGEGVSHASVGDSGEGESLDIQPEHPRIQTLKAALKPFTQIEADDSRPDEFVLFVRGTTITAGDVRKARKAMKI